MLPRNKKYELSRWKTTSTTYSSFATQNHRRGGDCPAEGSLSGLNSNVLKRRTVCSKA